MKYKPKDGSKVKNKINSSKTNKTKMGKHKEKSNTNDNRNK